MRDGMVKPYIELGSIQTIEGEKPLLWVIVDDLAQEQNLMHLICTAAIEPEDPLDAADYENWLRDVFIEQIFNKEEVTHIKSISVADEKYIENHFDEIDALEVLCGHQLICVDKSGPLDKVNWFYMLETKDGSTEKVKVTDIEAAAKVYFENNRK